jgi:hypothetical protein
MRHDYELQTDVLATLVANTGVEKKHAALIAMFAARTEFRAVRHVTTRDEFSSQPTRVLDAHNQEVAADYRAWIDLQLDRLGSACACSWCWPPTQILQLDAVLTAPTAFASTSSTRCRPRQRLARRPPSIRRAHAAGARASHHDRSCSSTRYRERWRRA